MKELREYQNHAVDALFEYVEGIQTGHPVVVLPTGAGKALCIAAFIERLVSSRPDCRILMVAHKKELIEQNYDELMEWAPNIPTGIYLASKRKRDLSKTVTIAGIASIYRHAAALGPVDAVLVDECHLIPPTGEGMYRTLIEGLALTNPRVLFIGFTATPFRLKSGMITSDSGLFTSIAYEKPISELIDEGYLVPLRTKVPESEVDMSKVRHRGGEFRLDDMQALMDNESLTMSIIDEIQQRASDRKSALVFCSGVPHAESFASTLRRLGFKAESLSGNTNSWERADIIDRFKKGEIQYLCSCDLLTTGFNAPNVDLVVILRATESVSLYVQIVGRAARCLGRNIEESKKNGKVDAMILDFCGNIERHGPIDCIEVKNVRAGKKKAPVKTCPQCRESLHISVSFCPQCSYVFTKPKEEDEEENERKLKALPFASTASIVRGKRKVDVVEFYVSHTEFSKYRKDSGSPYGFKVEHYCFSNKDAGLLKKPFIEWGWFDHSAKARIIAQAWWKKRTDYENTAAPVPSSTEEALELSHHILPVWVIGVDFNNATFPRIVWAQSVTPVDFDQDAKNNQGFSL